MIDTIKSGYKAVRYKDNKYWSVLVDCKATVQYMVNEWATHTDGCGPLSLFANYDSAVFFLKYYMLSSKQYKLFKCQYIESKYIELWHSDLNATMQTKYLPEDTILASSIMLIKQTQY